MLFGNQNASQSDEAGTLNPDQSDAALMELIQKYDDGRIDDGTGEMQFGNVVKPGSHYGDWEAPEGQKQDPPQPNQPNTPAGQETSEEVSEELQQQLTTLAETYRVSADDLKGFETAEEAEQALRDYFQNEASLGASFARAQQFQQMTPNGADAHFQQPSLQQPQQIQPGQTVPPPDFKEVLEKLDPEHPLRPVIEAQQQYLQSLHGQLSAVEQQQQAVRQQAEAAELRMLQNQIDNHLSKISSERFGTSQQANMFQAQRRQMVREKAEELAWSNLARNKPVPNVEQLLEDADRLLFYKEIEKERLRNRQAARQSQNGARLGRPTAAPTQQSFNEDVPFEENPDLIRYFYELTQRGS